jgi:hypothetical protein
MNTFDANHFIFDPPSLSQHTHATTQTTTQTTASVYEPWLKKMKLPPLSLTMGLECAKVGY